MEAGTEAAAGLTSEAGHTEAAAELTAAEVGLTAEAGPMVAVAALTVAVAAPTGEAAGLTAEAAGPMAEAEELTEAEAALQPSRCSCRGLGSPYGLLCLMDRI